MKVRAAAAEAHAAAEQHARRVEELERQLGMAAERSDHTVRAAPQRAAARRAARKSIDFGAQVSYIGP